MVCILFLQKRHISLRNLHSLMLIFYEMECNMYMYMFNLFYVCINLSRCIVIPKSKQLSLYVIVWAHKLELASRAFIQRNENENEK